MQSSICYELRRLLLGWLPDVRQSDGIDWTSTYSSFSRRLVPLQQERFGVSCCLFGSFLISVYRHFHFDLDTAPPMNTNERRRGIDPYWCRFRLQSFPPFFSPLRESCPAVPGLLQKG